MFCIAIFGNRKISSTIEIDETFMHMWIKHTVKKAASFYKVEYKLNDSKALVRFTMPSRILSPNELPNKPPKTKKGLPDDLPLKTAEIV